MKNKGVELTLNVVILIVIGLIVAAILIYLISSSVRNANRSVTACEDKGNRCDTSCADDEVASSFFAGGCDEGYICCQKAPI